MTTVYMAETEEKASTPYEEYIASRGEGAMKEIDDEYRKFKGIDQEFDGGDSGGGVVGDGNTDLEDQHNSPSIVRGGFGEATVGEGASSVGRGQVLSAEDTTVAGATEARTASARGNYFGRTTGYAEKLIDDGMDSVRAQQLENWQNQNALNSANRASGQGVVFGGDERKKYIAREALVDQQDMAKDGYSLSQADLAKHLQNQMLVPAQRLDGEEWAALEVSPDDEVEQTFELRGTVGGTVVEEFGVANMYNTFAPFRCVFTGDSASSFSATPEAGTMNRRSGEPVQVIVRYKPQEYGPPTTATLVFETEDFRKIYKFIGSS